MSHESNQSRQDQYSPIKMSVGKLRKERAPLTSPKAGRDPIQPNNRGPQGNG